jgi:predicted nucleic acid-binding protein
VVVDTSVFVEFFRGRQVPRFEALLRANAVVLSPFVRLELLMGVRKRDARTLEQVLGGIPLIPNQPEWFAVAETFLGHLKGSGLSVGLVDLAIAAEASLLRSRVLSLDGVFARLAARGLIELDG